MGVFDKIKQSLTRTTQQFLQRFDEASSRADSEERRGQPVDIETIDALEEALLSADVGVAATTRIVEAVRRQSRSGSSLRQLVQREILDILHAADAPSGDGHQPHVVL